MKPRRHKSPSHERWLVSYADFITLMFAFFVVLYASATADQKKQAQMAESIDAAFRSLGIFPSPARKAADNAGPAGSDKPVVPMNIVMGEDVLAPAQVKQDLDRIKGKLTQTLSNEVASHTVSIQMGHDGLVISLREAGFFSSGSAMPKPDTLPTLRKIAASLAHTPYDLRIEGHTDDIPIHTAEFRSNWELSTARATDIARLLIDKGLIPPERISAAGYAQYHPMAGNDTAAGRAENRRVDLVVLPRTKVNFAASSSSGPDGEWRKITDVN
ncbi:MAG TPA: flagellar motor protein MotB [Terracidiphilus sp.]|nr:flagellar motor protein MotB [Terracidiphilus sp.]